MQQLSYSMDRRSFLTRVAGRAAGLAVSTIAMPVSARRSKLSTSLLRGSLTLISADDANLVAAQGGDASLLVDSGPVEHGKELAKLLGVHKKPLQALFNTHWHLNHTGANGVFAREGLPIIAHENTRLWMTTEIRCEWQDRVYPPRPVKARPTKTFHYGKQTFDFGGRKLEYGYLPQGHTDGDMYVFFPDENVFVAGGSVSSSYPVIDYSTGGWIGGLVKALEAVVALTDKDTIVVAKSGPVVSRAEVQAEFEMCKDIYDKIAENYRKARNFDDLMATKPTQAYDARWGDPTRFMTLAYRSAWNHTREFGIF